MKLEELLDENGRNIQTFVDAHTYCMDKRPFSIYSNLKYTSLFFPL